MVRVKHKSKPSFLLQNVRRLSILLSVVGVILLIEYDATQQQYVIDQVGDGGGGSAFGNIVANSEESVSLSVDRKGIPHSLVFTYKHNILDTKEPKLLYENVMHTIEEYRSAWNEPRVPVRFLDDPACRIAIERAEPKLVRHFDNEKEGKFRGDICRVADLYNNGGYYFDVDIAVIQPLRLNATITFSSILSGFPNWDHFFQAFLAAAPHHPVLAEALRIMRLYYEGKHAIRGKNVGTSTLKDAYDAIDEEARGQSKLLFETRNTKEDGAKGGWYYPEVPKLPGVGCCCDQIAHDPTERMAYFYARIPGSGKYCRLPPAKTTEENVEMKVGPASQVDVAIAKTGRVARSLHGSVKAE